MRQRYQILEAEERTAPTLLLPSSPNNSEILWIGSVCSSPGLHTSSRPWLGTCVWSSSIVWRRCRHPPLSQHTIWRGLSMLDATYCQNHSPLSSFFHNGPSRFQWSPDNFRSSPVRCDRRSQAMVLWARRSSTGEYRRNVTERRIAYGGYNHPRRPCIQGKRKPYQTVTGPLSLVAGRSFLLSRSSHSQNSAIPTRPGHRVGIPTRD